MNRITLRLRHGRVHYRRLSPKHVRDASEGESLPSVSVQAPPSCSGEGGAASGDPMWCRVPLELPPLRGSYKASAMEATVDLLCRWGRGEGATARRLRADWLWSNDRVTAHVTKTEAWAEANGARIVRSDVARTPTIDGASSTAREPSENRPQESPANAGKRRATVREPSADRPKTVQPADPPRARVEVSDPPTLREREREERLEEKREADKGPRSAPALPPVSVPVADGGEVAAVDPDLLRVWDALCEFKRPGKRELTDTRRARLAAALRRHGIDVLLRVGRWAARSQHERAAFLRTRKCDVDTLLWASRLQAYVELSAEPDVDPRSLAAFARWRALTGQPGEPTPALVAPILAAIEQIGEAETIAVIEWVLTGTDDKAKFLQSKGITSIQRVLKPDFLHGRRDLARAAKPVRIGDRPAVTPTTATGSPEADDGVNLGPNAFLGYSPTDHLRRTRRPPPT